MTTLEKNGWEHYPDIKDTSGFLDLARSLGSIWIDSGEQELRRLSCMEKPLAPPGTLSRTYGTGAFPLHTDTAFWSIPCRYLVLMIEGDSRRRTHLLHFQELRDRLPPKARNGMDHAIWRIRASAGPKYLRSFFRCGPQTGWRQDLTTMIPVNDHAACLADALSHECRNLDNSIAFSWETGGALVIDNWAMLHARGHPPQGEEARTVIRAYVLGEDHGLG